MVYGKWKPVNGQQSPAMDNSRLQWTTVACLEKPTTVQCDILISVDLHAVVTLTNDHRSVIGG